MFISQLGRIWKGTEVDNTMIFDAALDRIGIELVIIWDVNGMGGLSEDSGIKVNYMVEDFEWNWDKGYDVYKESGRERTGQILLERM